MTRRQREAERSAAWAVMRSDRRFLGAYALAAAGCSLAGNLGHVWTLRHAAEPPLWMAYAWAAVAPVLLMLAAYAKPTLKRMLALGRSEGVDEDTGDGISSAVVWAVFLGAFAWSAYGIYGFTVAVGVPASVAWIAPATIDVALFGALRGLVLTAPIAARMKADLEPVAAPVAPPRAAAPAAPAARPAPAAPTAAPAARPAPAAPTAAPAAPAAAPAAPAAAPAASATSAPLKPAATSPEHHDRAAAVVASGVTAKPAADVAAVLQLLDAGASDRRIQSETRIDARTVARIRRADADAAAAADAEPAPTLVAVN